MTFPEISQRAFLLVLLAAGTHCTSSVPEILAPDRVLHNGKIVTVDESFSIA